MNLLEYEAKQLLRGAGIPVPVSQLVAAAGSLRHGATEAENSTATTFTAAAVFPVVLKSQVPVGGRGKAGGVVVVNAKQQLEEVSEKLFHLPIKGFLPSVLLAEEKLAMSRELYVSLSIDRKESAVKLLAHAQGGVEVETNLDFKSWRLDYAAVERPEEAAEGHQKTTTTTEGVSAAMVSVTAELADYFQLPAALRPQLQALVLNLLHCLKQSDAMLLEINPLILTTAGQLVAGDCKMVLDDNAAFRHPEWKFEAARAEANFVTLDANGTIGTLANGAGLAMATVDAVADSGLVPANFLDLGGGATADTVRAALGRMLQFPHIEGVIINIFGGLTRCDEVAKAVIQARADIPNLPPLFIRLDGTNVAEAKQLLAQHHIPLFATLEDCLNSAGAAHE